MKKGLKVLSILLVFMFVFAVIAGCAAPDTSKKTVTLTVVYQDEKEEEFQIETNAATLGDAMYEKGLINKEEHDSGFVTTINGVYADWDADGAWWALYDSEGNSTDTGISDTKISDKDSYKFVYTIG